LLELQGSFGPDGIRTGLKSVTGFDGIVMPALVADSHVLTRGQNKDVDGRDKARP
jgi:hypothetical protein